MYTDNKNKEESGNFWISYADLMAGLLFVFILLLGAIVVKYVFIQTDLQAIRTDLQKEKDALGLSEDELSDKKQRLEKIKSELKNTQQENFHLSFELASAKQRLLAKDKQIEDITIQSNKLNDYIALKMKTQRKPEWLLKKVFFAQKKDVEIALKDIGIHTVCQEAMCPNMSECFSKKLATFMILGSTCTRACSYCNVDTGMPSGIDEKEPQKVATAVKSLGLKHVVITSVTRDDLSDGGANQFIKCVEAIKAMDTNITVELLIPDLQYDKNALHAVANCGAEVVGHNMETVPRLYSVRKGANYKKSLEVLKTLKLANPKVKTKSSLMLGLGENEDEIRKVFQDLLDIDCTLLTMGQYLAPSKAHTPVIDYIEPKKFEELGQIASDMGFEFVKSSPYTRSSYMAHEYFENEGELNG